MGEDHIRRLQEEVVELHEWRSRYEQQMKDQFQQVDDHFGRDDVAFAEYQ